MLLQNTVIYVIYLLSWTTLIAQAYPNTVAESDGVALNRRSTTCNGHAEFCNRSFGNITFIGSHDSYSIGTTCVLTTLYFSRPWAYPHKSPPTRTNQVCQNWQRLDRS